jgi:hypothetical protein
MAVLYRFPAQPQPYTAGTAVTAAALTSGLVGVALPVIPGGIITPGARLDLRAHLEITSTSATPTCSLGFYFGAVTGAAIAIGSEVLLGAATGIVISATATAWALTMQYNGTFRQLATAGAANGIIHGSGEVHSFWNTGLTAAGVVLPLGVTAAGRTVATYNTAVANQLDIGVTLTSVTGTPSVTVTDFWGEVTG